MKQSDLFTVVVGMVSRERQRQIHKWGIQSHDNTKWALIAGEEMGEINTAVLHSNAHTFEERIRKILDRERDERADGPPGLSETGDPVMDEVVQLAAVCCAWLEHGVAALLGEKIDDATAGPAASGDR